MTMDELVKKVEYLEQLTAAAPNARYVLNTRNGTAWARSIKNHGSGPTKLLERLKRHPAYELPPGQPQTEAELIARVDAVECAAVLLRLVTDSFISRGPDISFLSAFPAEREFLFPPLTYLAPTGNVEKIAVGGASWDVVDVKPHL